MIKILDKQVAELIAAGEVIERPASIVKELIENAVDAGATSITAETSGGGSAYIKVADNGYGIPENEIRTAFMRHATSKISSENDLENINTLGFRGEALASVCAVSKTEIITKTVKSLYGVKYTAGNAAENEMTRTGAADGTTIIVRDLFYNVPARLKFLKKDSAESAAVTSIIENLALSRPDISFCYVRDGKTVIRTPGDGSLLSAIYSLKGSAFSDNLIVVKYNTEDIKVSGFVCVPETALPSRNCQRFFVNNRVVRSPLLTRAVEEAYRGGIMRGRFPACYLMISIPSDRVDVNVHPAKIEVRFTDEREVYDAVLAAAQNALEEFSKQKTVVVQPQPEVELQSGQYPQTPVRERSVKDHQNEQIELFSAALKTKKTTELRTEEPIYPIKKGQKFEHPCEKEKSKYKYIYPDKLQKKTDARIITEDGENNNFDKTAGCTNTGQTPEILPEIIYIGEIFKTYIIAGYDDSMYIIDKHAAHERIIYNQLINTEKEARRQLILPPVPVQLSSDEFEVATENKQTLEKFGYAFDDFGRNTVIIREIPLVLAQCDAADVFKEIAVNMSLMKKDFTPDTLFEMYCLKACKAAIKANDNNTPEELALLAEKVIKDSDIRYCPHGRPVLIAITKEKLAGMMGR